MNDDDFRNMLAAQVGLAAVLLGIALLTPGCRPQLVLQLGGAVSPERQAWERQVSEHVNDHTVRIERLEALVGIEPVKEEDEEDGQ